MPLQFGSEFPSAQYKQFEDSGTLWVRKQDSTVREGRNFAAALDELSGAEFAALSRPLRQLSETIFSIETDRQVANDAMLDAIFRVAEISDLAKSEWTPAVTKRGKAADKLKHSRQKQQNPDDVAAIQAEVSRLNETAATVGCDLSSLKIKNIENLIRTYIHSQITFHARALEQLTSLAGSDGIDPSALLGDYIRTIQGAYDSGRPLGQLMGDEAQKSGFDRQPGTLGSGTLTTKKPNFSATLNQNITRRSALGPSSQSWITWAERWMRITSSCFPKT